MNAAVRSALALGTLLLALQLGVVPSAQALESSAARVTLRDDHVEVLVELDLLGLMTQLNPKLGDVTALSRADESGLTQATQVTKDLLHKGSQLIVNGATSPLLVTGFPTPADIRNLSGYAAANPRTRREPLVIRLEALKPVTDAHELTVTLPKEAGAVRYTFVQPATRLATAGERVAFPVLAPQSAARSH
jgi:hypothetical protein